MRSFLVLLLLGACAVPPPGVQESSSRTESSTTTRGPSTSQLGRMVHDEANAARRANGVARLDWSADLAAVAEAHSREMARSRRFDHTDSRGDGAFERTQRAGLLCRTVAENLYLTTRYRTVSTGREAAVYDWYTPRELAQRTILGWLESRGHRRNLLDAELVRHGIGVAVGRDERVYITQVLCA